jgi:hypothetical protein
VRTFGGPRACDHEVDPQSFTFGQHVG